MIVEPLSLITPNWDAPDCVVAFTTTRQNGFSEAPYNSLNLGTNSGDTCKSVEKNRHYLQQQLALPNTPAWLNQVHKAHVVEITAQHTLCDADASFTRTEQQVCSILTADCLPILLCNTRGDEVAAIHAGWRSLASGIIEKTVQHFKSAPKEILAWLGPCICRDCYEIGREVYQAFTKNMASANAAFTPTRNDHWLADLPKLAEQRLRNLQINAITLSNYCTMEQQTLFYSYRREGNTGRMASMIYNNG